MKLWRRGIGGSWKKIGQPKVNSMITFILIFLIVPPVGWEKRWREELFGRKREIESKGGVEQS